MDGEKNTGARANALASVVKTVLAAAFISLVFLAAGTLRWPRMWLYLGFYIAVTSSLMVWLKKRNPDLLEERLTARKKADVKRWDRAIVAACNLLLLIMYLVIPLDAVRFGWSRIPPLISWLGFASVLAAWIIVFRAFRVNSFLSGFVRIQFDRGQTVCTTGPYRFVRHPMYLANILSSVGVPLFLGSMFGLIPAGLITALFGLRTSLEDKTLQNELPGYADYAANVCWRLVPGIW